MHDSFSGKPTCICGPALLDEAERRGLQDDHRRRLEALARLRAAAAQCGVATDPDRDLVTLPEDAISLLERGDPIWADLGAAIRQFRDYLPLCRLEDFGFPADAENPLEEPNPQLQRIGGGVEAWAFAALADHSVYKFFQPRENKRVGSSFRFRPGEESLLLAEARLGDYRELLEKLLIINALGGMPTEIIGVTPEGVLVAKQTLGTPLPQGEDVSTRLPAGLIEIPSRFLRANRDHPRLFFLEDAPWLVADLHARNLVRCLDGGLRVIDLVASPWPEQPAVDWMQEWLTRVRTDPRASALQPAADEDL